MKTNMMRMLSLVLVLLMALTVFAGCKDDKATEAKSSVAATPATSSQTEPVIQQDVILDADESDPFTTVESDAVLMVVDEATGDRVLEVAEGTTLEAVLAAVPAKEGYTQKVTDAEGNEVTDVKAVVADGMVVAFFAADAEEAAASLAVKVVAKEEIQAVIQQQENIDKNNEQVKNPGNSQNSSSTTTTGGKDPGPTTTTGGNEPDPTTTTGGKDPAKISITLSSVWGANYSATDATGKAWQEVLNNMQNKQGITTTITTLDANSATDTIVKEVMAGKSSADVYDISQVMCRNVARKKAAANIYASKTLNKSLFQCGATESVTFGGKAYGVTFAAKSVNPMSVIYNKDLIKKYASKYDIVKLYDEKKWNFETFQEIAKLCTQDTDGNGKTDIFGFTSNTNIIGMALTANAGGTALKVNEKVEATMCNEAGITALQWCKDMFKTDKSWNYKADINDCITEFTGGKAAMFVSYLRFYRTIAEQASFPIGFVLMPMGPDQSGYKNGVYDGAYYVVPTTKESRLDDIGTWLNGMAGVANKLVSNNVKELAKNGFDAKSQEIYRWLVDNMTPEYSSGVFSSSISSEVDSSVTSAAKSPAKVMASIKTKAQKECDDYYAPLY